MNEPRNILFQDIRPNWNVCPGEILDEYRKEMGWTKKELALRLGISEKHLIDIKKGKVSISLEMANRLGLVFSQPPDFWLKLQAIYQEQTDYLKTQKLDSEQETGELT